MKNAWTSGRSRLLGLAMAVVGAAQSWAAAPPEFAEDFSKLPAGKLPDTFLVLDGVFVVREAGAERFLELPGAPLETFGVMFGPARKENWSARARFYGTNQGRRFPVFALSLNGVAGYRLQLAPAKKALEIVKGDEVRASTPLGWESGTWMTLRVQVRKAGSDGWVVEGKAWKDGTPEPASWMVTWSESEEPVSGRATVWGKPFSGTPIRFDDLEVRFGVD